MKKDKTGPEGSTAHPKAPKNRASKAGNAGIAAPRAKGMVKAVLEKCPTGIRGLDEITGGGFPKGRPTLVCGSAGCGKTLLAMEFLVRGAQQYDEPGVFVCFEENTRELAQNVSSLGFDLEALVKRKKLSLDYVYIERSEIEETGEYDLEGLFIRLENAINSVGARRIVLDTIESLFSGLPNENILRAELRRLFRWLKDRGVTALITGERGDGTLTRHGLEEYVADCVILLDHRVTDQISTRRMRIVKYRGSVHGTNEYPFLIDDSGFSVVPVTSLGLTHKASTERIRTGIPRLDRMLNGGYYRGSTILITGTAGTGKTGMAMCFAHRTCRNGERCLYVASEESESQIIRNGRSIGIDLGPYVKKGTLRFNAVRPTAHGLEMFLASIHRLMRDFEPSVVIIDPISSFTFVASASDVKLVIMRLIDMLKDQGITCLCTNLTIGGTNLEQTDVGVSSLMDTWIVVRELEQAGERTRGLYVLKSRGMAHSHQIRELVISDKGIDLLDVYTGAGRVLMGSARLTEEAKEKTDERIRRQELERKKRDVETKRKTLEARTAALRAEFADAEEELRLALLEDRMRRQQLAGDRKMLAQMRKADNESAEK